MGEREKERSAHSEVDPLSIAMERG